MTRKQHGFTLIELLVVISIITLLVAMLLPSLANARQSAVTLQCMTNQRSMFGVFNTYAQDFGQYPTNYPLNTTETSNSGNECAGSMAHNTAATYTYGGVTYNSNTTDVTAQLPKWFVVGMFQPASVIAHVAAKGYIDSPNMFGCTSTFNARWYLNNFNTFRYNGPGAHGRAIANNGGGSNLSLLGRHTQPFPFDVNPSWGVRFGKEPLYVGNRSWMTPMVALFTCNVKFENAGAQTNFIEPHGPPNSYNVGTQAQYDSIWWPTALRQASPFRRNVLYADGHGKYLQLNDRMTTP